MRDERMIHICVVRRFGSCHDIVEHLHCQTQCRQQCLLEAYSTWLQCHLDLRLLSVNTEPKFSEHGSTRHQKWSWAPDMPTLYNGDAGAGRLSQWHGTEHPNQSIWQLLLEGCENDQSPQLPASVGFADAQSQYRQRGSFRSSNCLYRLFLAQQTKEVMGEGHAHLFLTMHSHNRKSLEEDSSDTN